MIKLSSSAMTLDRLDLTPEIGSFVRSITLPPRILRICERNQPQTSRSKNKKKNEKETIPLIQESSSPSSMKTQTPKPRNKKLFGQNQKVRKDLLIQDLDASVSIRSVVTEVPVKGCSWDFFFRPKGWELVSLTS